MKLKLIELINKNEIIKTYEIYKHCMFLPTEEKFNKKIDGAVFLGLHGNPFGGNVVASAEEAENVVEGPLDFDNLITLEATTDTEPTALVGNRSLNVALRGISDEHGNYAYDRATSTIDGLPYHELKLANGETYPEGTLITGDFTNGLKYGVPNGTQLRIKIADQATLSKVQNTDPDTGDVHLFEQDMQACRFVFEIAVAIPNNESFAVLQPAEGV